MGFERVILGRTGLSVTRLGIGSSYGTNAAMVEAAAERGVNYFYWGAIRSKKMALGIRNVAAKDREKAIIVVHSGARTKSAVSRVVQKSMKTLGVDYLDVLLLAGRNSKPDPGLIEHIGKLKEDGQIRYLGVSGHNRSLFPELEKDKEIDVFHIRYNAAHRGAEHEAFDRLPAEGGAGIASFTNTRWGALINPSYMPSGETAPNAADCYRFALSHPRVHVAICGPNSMEQLLEDLTALEKGPMSDSELEHMRKIGDFIYKKVSRVRAQFNSIRSIRWR